MSALQSSTFTNPPLELGVDPFADDDVGELDVLHASPLEAILYGLDLMFQDVIDDLYVLKVVDFRQILQS